jgi:hypothetical protein
VAAAGITYLIGHLVGTAVQPSLPSATRVGREDVEVERSARFIAGAENRCGKPAA